MMIFIPLKQFAKNNWKYGENSRERNRVLHAEELGIVQGVASVLAQPDYSSIWGTDISHWDKNVQLSITKALGAYFTIIKALDGTIQTRYWLENRARAISAKLKQSAYAWLYPNGKVSCVAQAQKYVSLLVQYPTDIPPMIDFEWTYFGGQSADPTYKDLEIWVNEFNRLYLVKPLLYSAKGYMDKFGAMSASLKAKFGGFVFAHYGVSEPSLPIGFTTYDIHQFTSSGDAKLLSPNDAGKLEVDLNKVIDAQTWERLSGEIIGGTAMWYKATGNITMRIGAASSYPPAAINGVAQYVLVGDVLDTANPTNGFVQILQIFRNGAMIDIPNPSWCGSYYLTPTEQPMPPEPPAPTVKHTIEVYDNGDLVIDGKPYL